MPTLKFALTDNFVMKQGAADLQPSALTVYDCNVVSLFFFFNALELFLCSLRLISDQALPL